VRRSVSLSSAVRVLTLWMCASCASCASAPPVRPLDDPKSAEPALSDPSLEQATARAAGESTEPDGPAGLSQTLQQGSGWLGVELAAPANGEVGVLVRGVVPDSPAERAGLRTGDRIVTIDGAHVSRPGDVSAIVRGHRAGDRLGLVLHRAGAERLLSATLEPLPNEEGLMQKQYVDSDAPSLSGLTAIQGSVAPSLTALRGRVVVVEFWAGWCVPCRILAPVLSDWSDRYGARGLNVLGVTGDPADLALDAAQRHGMSYALFTDGTGATQQAYRAYALPTLFVIDRKGVVRDVMVGFSTERLRSIEGLVERLLAER
jgi:thiol-disulfide isomerase/thioredoxin